MNRKLTGTTLLLLGILLAVPSIYAVTTSFNVPTNGSISMVKVYRESNCTTEVTLIDWGSITPNSTVNQTVYIKNFGGVPVNITLAPSAWNPTNAVGYMAFTYVIAGGQIIPPNTGSTNVQQTTLTLTVFSNVTDTTISTFSFNIQVLEAW